MTMPPIFFIAWAHVTNRVRQTFIGVIGVATGVGFTIMIAGVMEGSQRQFVGTLVDAMPHITITDEHRSVSLQPAEQIYGAAQRSNFTATEKRAGITNSNLVIGSLRDWLPGAIAPSTKVTGMIMSGNARFGVTVTGIDPRQEERVSKLARQMVAGELYSLGRGSNAVLLGNALAVKIGARVGSSLTITPGTGNPVTVQVMGIYRSGVRAVDETTVYSLLRTAQMMAGQPDLVNELRVSLDQAFRAEEIASKIEGQTGYRAVPWQAANADLLSSFKVQEKITDVIMAAMMLASTFAIYSIISTITNEKRNDIAIMKSLGMKEYFVQAIFIIEAGLIALVGIPVGWLVGYLLCIAMTHIRYENPITEGALAIAIYYSPVHYAVVGLITLGCCLMSAFLPARKASHVHPVDIIRGAS
ncbi:FtsX-like permease family protein [Bradyrhizobium sp.]|uniref:ABC transporter permease n=1 Tax=Bradyrhizobium sp. TaxID=376 RepID=UPI0023974893|nr:FtsX-like permease family protein [Bradyrhizobium sp.]MDE2380172.1 ABC transporter permease [Bradyrhizobium sp.]